MPTREKKPLPQTCSTEVPAGAGARYGAGAGAGAGGGGQVRDLYETSIESKNPPKPPKRSNPGHGSTPAVYANSGTASTFAESDANLDMDGMTGSLNGLTMSGTLDIDALTAGIANADDMDEDGE